MEAARPLRCLEDSGAKYEHMCLLPARAGHRRQVRQCHRQGRQLLAHLSRKQWRSPYVNNDVKWLSFDKDAFCSWGTSYVQLYVWPSSKFQLSVAAYHPEIIGACEVSSVKLQPASHFCWDKHTWTRLTTSVFIKPSAQPTRKWSMQSTLLVKVM